MSLKPSTENLYFEAPWFKEMGPKVGEIWPYSENALNLYKIYSLLPHVVWKTKCIGNMSMIEALYRYSWSSWSEL